MGQEQLLQIRLTAQQLPQAGSRQRVHQRLDRSLDLQLNAVIVDHDVGDAGHVGKIRWRSVENNLDGERGKVA
jgi:hypothetical protein